MKTDIRKKQRWLVMLLAVIMTLPINYFCLDSKLVKGSVVAQAATKNKGIVTAQLLNVRTGAGMKYSIKKLNKSYIRLKKGTQVTIQNTKGDWYYVTFTYNKKTLNGYVSKQYIELTKKKSSTTILNKAGKSTTNYLNVRTGAGTNYSVLVCAGKKVQLSKNKSVTITGQKGNWYYVTFTYNNKTFKGYVSKTYIKITGNAKKVSTVVNGQGKKSVAYISKVTEVRVGASAKSKILQYNKKNVKLAKNTKVTVLSSTGSWDKISFTYDNKTLTGYISGSFVKYTNSTSSNGDTSFESKLSKQGFPESYKVLLRKLHNDYPNWEFVAYNTGIDFSTAVENEMVKGRSLIPNSKNIAWKSLSADSYNWATDKFIAYDGATWVNASEKAIRYYMDPRNFLYANSIYQFEVLSYKKAYQSKLGVEGILKNTPMSNTKVTYKDSKTKKKVTKLYSEIFMEAAKYSSVSPYHLASRVKQEVVTGTDSFSKSVTGDVSGYKGLYNYYNIGASNSTATLGAVKNGLKFAENGSKDDTLNKKYMIPWNNRYNAIVGGAAYIGEGYISKGQDTLYLEKFNVTTSGRYTHQYMCNIQAAWSEGLKVSSAYENIENYRNLPVVFSIPVYKNLPNATCSLPTDTKNPNNWLKSMSVSGRSLSPKFDSEVTNYTVKVKKDTKSINISATPVSSLASVSGTGKIELKSSTKSVKVVVTAENGSKKTYTINLER